MDPVKGNSLQGTSRRAGIHAGDGKFCSVRTGKHLPNGCGYGTITKVKR